MSTLDRIADADRSGFDAKRLAAIPGEMQRFVDSGDLSGMVTLIWRRGAIAQVDALGSRDLATGCRCNATRCSASRR